MLNSLLNLYGSNEISISTNLCIPHQRFNNLTNCSFPSGAYLPLSHFINPKNLGLTGAELRDSKITNPAMCDFSYADLTGAHLELTSQGSLFSNKFRGCNLADAVLDFSTLSGDQLIQGYSSLIQILLSDLPVNPISNGLRVISHQHDSQPIYLTQLASSLQQHQDTSLNDRPEVERLVDIINRFGNQAIASTGGLTSATNQSHP